jgi:hypothetical protein
MRKIYSIILVFNLFFFMEFSAYAIGFGLYGSINGGETYYGKLTLNGETNLSGNKIRTPNIIGGGGFVLDTNCAQDKIINYRLMFGYDRLFSKRFYVTRMNRMSLLNTLGFGIVRTELVRLWLGPQLGFYYLYGSNKYPDSAIYFSGYYKIEHSLAGISLGASLGLNVNIAEYITISFECGLRYIIYYGIQSRDTRMRSPFTYALVPHTSSSWIPSSSYEGYGYMSVMYRIKDAYHKKSGDSENK